MKSKKSLEGAAKARLKSLIKVLGTALESARALEAMGVGSTDPTVGEYIHGLRSDVTDASQYTHEYNAYRNSLVTD